MVSPRPSRPSTSQNPERDQWQKRKFALEKLRQIFVQEFGKIERFIHLGDGQQRTAPLIDNGK
jgi:hypothetical protein